MTTSPDSAEQARDIYRAVAIAVEEAPSALSMSTYAPIAALISERDSLRAELSKAGPKWWNCATHGPATANAWGCPECVREMRAELAAVRAEASKDDNLFVINLLVAARHVSRAQVDAARAIAASMPLSKMRHGINCQKAAHSPSGGYLHAEDDDGPYDVDGCTYCGRCHAAIDAARGAT